MDLISMLIGYAICVIFPVPFLSRWILDGWTWIKNKVVSE